MDEPIFTPALTYREPKAAVTWLAEAFGFTLAMAIETPGGDPAQSHYEMTLGGRGRIMIGGQWADLVRSPASGDRSTGVSVHVRITDDVDAHCARARAAGAVIQAEPADQFYGERTYRCTDLEGHLWVFGRRVREVGRREAEEAIGTPIHAPDWA